MFFQPKLGRFSSPGPNRNRAAFQLSKSASWSMRCKCAQQTAGESSDHFRRRPARNRGGKRVSQDTGRTAKGFAVASAKRIARGSPGNDSFAVHRYSTGVRRRGSEQERGRETREIAATSFPPYDLEYSIRLSTCSGISTIAPGDT